MIRHIIRMVWNRKRSTGLLLVELLVSFLVLCVVFSAGAYYVDNWRKPLGFDYHDVLTLVAMSPPADESNVEVRALRLAETGRLMDAIRSQPEVEGVSPLSNSPYSGSMSRRGINLKDGSMLQFMVSDVTPELESVLRLSVVNGRFLDDSDAGAAWTSVVVNRPLAVKLFGRDNPIGRTIDGYDDNGTLQVPESEAGVMKVVGVIDDYRKSGEFSDSPYAAFTPMHLTDPERSYPAQEYLVRVARGTPAAFEEKLLRLLQGVAPEYSLQLTPLSITRTGYIRSRLLPLVILAIVAGFLILMVGMGLVGVLWQNVSQRSKEFGLRRAMGATGGDIQGQVLGEMLALTTLAMLVGSILFLQIPMLKLPGFITLKTSLAAIVASMVVLYPFVSLCSLYPSWLASAVQPVEALQHE